MMFYNLVVTTFTYLLKNDTEVRIQTIQTPLRNHYYSFKDEYDSVRVFDTLNRLYDFMTIMNLEWTKNTLIVSLTTTILYQNYQKMFQ